MQPHQHSSSALVLLLMGMSCCGVSPELSEDFLVLQLLKCSSDFVLCCAHGFIQQRCWTVTPRGQTSMDLRSSRHSPRRMDTKSTTHDAPDTTWAASGPRSPGTGGLNIEHTESAQGWLPLGLGSSPLSHPQQREEQRARQGALEVCKELPAFAAKHFYLSTKINLLLT